MQIKKKKVAGEGQGTKRYKAALLMEKFVNCLPHFFFVDVDFDFEPGSQKRGGRMSFSH